MGIWYDNGAVHMGSVLVCYRRHSCLMDLDGFLATAPTLLTSHGGGVLFWLALANVKFFAPSTGICFPKWGRLR